MGLKGRTPETGGRVLTFTHDKCHGKPRHGWLSGDVHVLECHVGEKKPSRPCERVLLGSKAPCPGCSDRRAVESLGFVPIRDQTGKPTMVLVRKAVILFIAKMDAGIPVTYGRDEGAFESVYVVHRLVDAEWKRYFSHPPADSLMPWLPTFLKVPHLAAAMREWFRGECQPAVTQAEPLPEIVEPVNRVVIPETPPDARGIGTLGPALSFTTRRIDAQKARERAEQNGQH